MVNTKKYFLPASVFGFVGFLLTMIQLKVDSPMLLLERFFAGGGWVELTIIAIFSAYLAYKMQNPANTAQWRKVSWSIFSIWFFLQLLLGIVADERFLLTGKLHLPIPAMIISGPIFRGEKSIMTLLFLSTIVLTGPAWCSQLCYFGAIDNYFARGKTSRKKIRNKFPFKHLLLLLTILGTLILRYFNVSPLNATFWGLGFGLTGIGVMLLFSKKQNRMIHCTVYCPIGTVVNYLKWVNPFRMRINNNCDLCMACSSNCKYDALRVEHIQAKKPGLSCTLCGDCISTCKSNSIHYKFPGLAPSKARQLYLFLTISLYAIFLAMGRI